MVLLLRCVSVLMQQFMKIGGFLFNKHLLQYVKINLFFCFLPFSLFGLNPVPSNYESPLLPSFTEGKVKYWLILGDCNVCGRIGYNHEGSKPSLSDYTNNPLVLRYGNRMWKGYSPIKNGVGTGVVFASSDLGEMGLGDFFAKEMTIRDPNHYFGAIGLCMVGTNWLSWTKQENPLQKNTFYRFFLRNETSGYASIAYPPMGKCGTEKEWCHLTPQFTRFGDWGGVILFLNSGDQTSLAGTKALRALIQGFRETFQKPTLPFVIGQFPSWGKGTSEGKNAVIKISDSIDYARSVQTSDLPAYDGIHYDRDGAITIAKRICDAFASIEKERQLSEKTVLTDKSCFHKHKLKPILINTPLHNKNALYYTIDGQSYNMSRISKKSSMQGVFIEIQK